MALSRENLLAKAATKIKETSLPDGSTIFVRYMTPGFLERVDKLKSNFEKSQVSVLECVVDADNQPLFQNLKEVADLPLPVFQELSDAVGVVNDLKKPEEVAKN